MSWKLLRRNRNKQVVIDAMPPNTQINIETNTGNIDLSDNAYRYPELPNGKLMYVETPKYKEPTDKELLDGLWEGEQFEAASRITELKKENANLKRKLTILEKKYEQLFNDHSITINDETL